MINDKKNIIAVFDFDGTITTKDSFLDILIFAFGYKKFIKGIFYLASDLLAYFLNKISAHTAKEKVFSYFFKGFIELEFNKLCRNYSLNQLNRIIRREAFEKIKWHKEQAHTLIIASASMGNWIKPWALENGFDDIVATKLEVERGKITGKFSTPNCSGKEKVRRLLENYPNKDNYYFYAYSDSKKDSDLLAFADESFYRKF